MGLDIHEPPAMVTTSAGHFDLMNPSPGMVDWDSIAVSLSRQPRYTGHSDVPVSIGAHLLLCGWIAETYYCANENPKLMLAVLLHDAHEAYTGDICRPLKRLINDRSDGLLTLIEHKVDTAIHTAAGIDMVELSTMKRQIKMVDNWALAAEVRCAFAYAHKEWSGMDGVPLEMMDVVNALLEQSPEQVEEAWCNLVHICMERINNEETEYA